jgi:hypothetical protein
LTTEKLVQHFTSPKAQVAVCSVIKTASELRLINVSVNQISDKGSFSQPAGSKITIEDLERNFLSYLMSLEN